MHPPVIKAPTNPEALFITTRRITVLEGKEILLSSFQITKVMKPSRLWVGFSDVLSRLKTKVRAMGDL